MGRILEVLEGLHPVAVYLVLGLGAAIENIVPPIPADTFVLVGGFIAAQGRAAVVGVYLATWLANVAGAMLVYEVGRRHGMRFFTEGAGRHLLSAGQLQTVDRFYTRWGVSALLVTRFLPGLRAVVPIFAGVSQEPVRRVLPPILLASAVWYGGLVWLGATAGVNLDGIEAWMVRANRGFLGIAILAVLPIAWWWKRSRNADSAEPEA